MNDPKIRYPIISQLENRLTTEINGIKEDANDETLQLLIELQTVMNTYISHLKIIPIGTIYIGRLKSF